MWVHTPEGFYSVVADRRDPETLVVRARVRGDLQRLKRLIPDLRIVKGGGTDYQFRARVSREAWALAVARMAGEIDYGNFKDEVKRRLGPRRADVCMDVWSALWGLVRRPRRRSLYDNLAVPYIDTDALDREIDGILG